MIATEEDVAKHNSKISLTTDYYNNEKTIGFYRSLGYQDYYEFVTYPNRRIIRPQFVNAHFIDTFDNFVESNILS